MSGDLYSRSGLGPSSPVAHTELAAIIIGLALRRWQLPQQLNDIIYSDCPAAPSPMSLMVLPPNSPNSQPNSHSSKQYSITCRHFSHKASPYNGPKPLQKHTQPLPNTLTKIRESLGWLRCIQPPNQYYPRLPSATTSNSPYQTCSVNPYRRHFICKLPTKTIDYIKTIPAPRT